jgi:alkaline phosphatase
MKAMVEGAYPANNSYAIVEIDNDLNISIDGFYNCEI